MELDVQITRVVIQNYKSIAACDVSLGPLTFLVGPNGSGKSNFVDALRFVSECLRGSLDNAIHGRGGINDVRRRSGGRPTDVAIRLEFRVKEWNCQYALRVGPRPGNEYRVRREYWKFSDSASGAVETYDWRDGKLETNLPFFSDALPDGLALSRYSTLPSSALRVMGFYDFNPDQIKALQDPRMDRLLLSDGSNVASIYSQMIKQDRPAVDRVQEFLNAVVPEVESVRVRTLGPKETLEFTERSGGRKDGRFFAANMSDGTLRVFAMLVALFNRLGPGNALAVIEEPEMALHPAAAGVVHDILKEASGFRQVIVTSHSADLLDRSDIAPDSILAVERLDGQTVIGPIRQGQLKSLRENLTTPGELLRVNHLSPDVSRVPREGDMSSLIFGR
ncbi:MAG: chromosome segregation protein SMC [Acidobacteria bacterium]|nr:chromosome segregation protein SMC [Acidobacteriota bacterium]